MDFSCGWTGGRTGIEGTLRGPRGPKKYNSISKDDDDDGELQTTSYDFHSDKQLPAKMSAVQCLFKLQKNNFKKFKSFFLLDYTKNNKKFMYGDAIFFDVQAREYLRDFVDCLHLDQELQS